MDYGCVKNKNNVNNRLFSKFEASFNLTRMIHKPTRVANKSSNLIDLIFSSNTEIIAGANVIKYNTSDHDLIYINFKKPLPLLENISFKYGDFKKLNLARLNYDFSHFDWTEFYSSIDSLHCRTCLYKAYLHT